MIHTASRPLTLAGARGVESDANPPVDRFMMKNLPDAPDSVGSSSPVPTHTSVRISSPGLTVKLLITCSVGCCGRNSVHA